MTSRARKSACSGSSLTMIVSRIGGGERRMMRGVVLSEEWYSLMELII